METLSVSQPHFPIYNGTTAPIEELKFQNANIPTSIVEEVKISENKVAEQLSKNAIQDAYSSLLEDSMINQALEDSSVERKIEAGTIQTEQASEAINTENPTVNVEEPKPEIKRAENSPLECNICYEESIEPVATYCGHIFCWSCVYKWIEYKRGSAECPNCKNTITKEKLIPLYPKNYDDEKKNADVTNGVPKRPLAAREDNNGGFRGSGLFTGINIHSRNFAMTIGCLPTLLPIVIMVLVNIYAILSGNDDDYIVDDSDADYHFGGEYRRPLQQQEEFYHETDGFDWAIILIMIIFVSLPFILRRFSRRNNY